MYTVVHTLKTQRGLITKSLDRGTNLRTEVDAFDCENLLVLAHVNGCLAKSITITSVCKLAEIVLKY